MNYVKTFFRLLLACSRSAKLSKSTTAMAMSMRGSGMICFGHSFATTTFLPPSTKITGGLQRIWICKTNSI